ncbi:MAG: T9SS type A sorting domain-containing protein [Bacteroidota bacterium]
MKKYLLLSFTLLIHLSAKSQNWANNISCILYSHCTSCHNQNGIAPFPLLTYSDALANASEIKNQVQNKLMPPFLADVSYQQYAHQKTLSQDEINQITNWVDNGAPSGDTTLAMTPPSYAAGGVFVNPDFSSSIGTYNLPTLNNDEYRCFVISNPFATDEYITAFEVVPGNRAAVHHVLIFSDDSNTPVQLDNNDPDPGYLSFGGTGSPSSQLIGGFVPGSDPYFLPSNMGMFVPAGSRIIIQIHYPLSSSGLTDSTRVNFIFSPVAVREAADAAALDHSSAIVDGPLFIPANTVKTFHEEYTIPVDVSVLSVAPHAHLVCISMTSYAITPVGDTIHFETIPHWNFHWQGAYYFQKPIHLPAGTILYGEATYDNTTNNPENPNDPPQNVSLGESTTDEMMLFYFVYVFYQPGDENIVIDTTGHIPHYLNCSSVTSVAENDLENNGAIVFPNPANEKLSISSKQFAIQSIWITDMLGKQVEVSNPISGNLPHNIELDIQKMDAGLYLLKVTGEKGIVVRKKFLITR